MGLHSAILYVKDLDQMTRFYGGLLGVQPTNRSASDVWACFESRGTSFALHAIPADIGATIEITSPAVPREDGALKLIFEVADVECERDRLEKLGGRAIRREWQQPGEACDVVDPEGNIFQLKSFGD